MQPPDATGVAPSPGDRRSSISSSKVPEGSLASRDAKPLKLDNASEQELSSQVQGDASINEQLQACAKEIDAIAAQALAFKTENLPSVTSPNLFIKGPLFDQLQGLDVQIMVAENKLAVALTEIQRQSSAWTQAAQVAVNQNYSLAEASLKALKNAQQDLVPQDLRYRDIVNHFNEVTQLLGKTNRQQLEAFCTLFFGEGGAGALDMMHCMIHSEFSSELQTEVPSDVFQSRVRSLSFSSLDRLLMSLMPVPNPYAFRFLIHRPLSEECLSKKPEFSPILKILEDVRTRKSPRRDAFLKARANLSSTAQRSGQAEVWWLGAEGMVNRWARTKVPMTSAQIAKLYNIVYEGLNSDVEKYRIAGQNVRATLVGRDYLPGEYVKDEVRAFTYWLANSLAACDEEFSIPLVIATAAKAYQWLVSIHPFNDGNGRTSRLVMDYVLLRYGLPPPMLSDTSVAIWTNPEAAVWKALQNNVGPDHAFELVWEGVTNSYRFLTAENDDAVRIRT